MRPLTRTDQEAVDRVQQQRRLLGLVRLEIVAPLPPAPGQSPYMTAYRLANGETALLRNEVPS